MRSSQTIKVSSKRYRLQIWSRARHVGQDLHHLIAGSRCSVCRSSPRVRRSRVASFSWKSAGCNGRTARRPRNCAISQRASAWSRSGRQIAIPRPSRRRETVERLNDDRCVVDACAFTIQGVIVDDAADADTTGTTYTKRQHTKRSYETWTHARLISPSREVVCSSRRSFE